MEKRSEVFAVPTAAARAKALGSFADCKNLLLKKTLEDADKYHKPLPKPGPDDWLVSHTEKGQPFEVYETSRHNKVTAARNVIYVHPLQEMDKAFVEACQKFCAAFYYPLNVKIIQKVDLKGISVASRINDDTEKIQYNASQILKVMMKYLPADAYAMICILFDDIYNLSLIHICRCRRYAVCRSRWSPYH
eukprot:TRINITY_DN2877_c0_g2_i7.p2 TRINITY_DN2877_c0_g2~~TRINITY_DN2877_c0_g2_i7.p2  ORF type:complete len:191 (-),score=47.11 TRINITY_DN2877_c0_g2_i7:18-590(-)